ncbi:hypothetical protein ACROYT_G015135 [Oculina patagonica]
MVWAGKDCDDTMGPSRNSGSSDQPGTSGVKIPEEKGVTGASSETQGQLVGATGSLSGQRDFRAKVYNIERNSPWALCLTEPVPEAFELLPLDWPQKYFSGQSVRLTRRATLTSGATGADAVVSRTKDSRKRPKPKGRKQNETPCESCGLKNPKGYTAVQVIWVQCDTCHKWFHKQIDRNSTEKPTHDDISAPTGWAFYHATGPHSGEFDHTSQKQSNAWGFARGMTSLGID